MGKFFSEVGTRVGDLVSHPVKISKDLVTNPSKGWDELTNLYTHNTHKDQDLFQNGLGIRGWVGDHPQETAAAVVASIFGGWAAAGAGGGAAAGGSAAGAASGAGAGAGGAATAGTAGATGTGLGAAGTGSAYGISATPFGTAGVGGQAATTGIGAGSVSATPFSAGSSVLSYAPTQSAALSGAGTTSGQAASSFDLQSFIQNANRLQNAMNGQQQDQTQQQQQNFNNSAVGKMTSGYSPVNSSSTPYSQALARQQAITQSNPFAAQNNPFLGG